MENEKIVFEDNTNACKMGLGCAHSIHDPVDESQWGICVTMTMHMPPKKVIQVYNIKADDNKKRTVLANIPIDQFIYEHAFMMTPNYIIVLDAAYYFDMTALMMKGTMTDAL